MLTEISNFAVGWTTKKCDRDATDLPTKLIPIACPTCVTLIGFTAEICSSMLENHCIQFLKNYIVNSNIRYSVHFIKYELKL